MSGWADWVSAIAAVCAVIAAVVTYLHGRSSAKKQLQLSKAALESQERAAQEDLASFRREADAERKDARSRAGEEILLDGRALLYADLLQLSEEHPEGKEAHVRLSALAGRTWIYASPSVGKAYDAIMTELNTASYLDPGAEDWPSVRDGFSELTSRVLISWAETRADLKLGRDIRSEA